METSLKTGSAQIFSCCPKKSELPKIWGGGAAAPLAPPARTPMSFIYSERDIFDYIISTRITGKIAELFRQVIQDQPHHQGENK